MFGWNILDSHVLKEMSVAYLMPKIFKDVLKLQVMEKVKTVLNNGQRGKIREIFCKDQMG